MNMNRMPRAALVLALIVAFVAGLLLARALSPSSDRRRYLALRQSEPDGPTGFGIDFEDLRHD